MKGQGTTKIRLLVTIVFLVLSLVLSVLSLFPLVTENSEKTSLINDSFRLSQNEVYRKGIGTFQGGENISVRTESSTPFSKNFSLITNTNSSFYVNSSNLNVAYSFTADPGYYYEAIFHSNSPNSNWVNFQVTVEKQQILHPYSVITTPAKIMFLLSLGASMLIIIKGAFIKRIEKLETKPTSPPTDKIFRNRLLAFILVSLVLWLILLALNSNALATVENWFTDHVRHSYVSTLFLKDGLSVFSQPLGTLSSQDHSHFMYVTWPEMPHLYPLGSILVFLPFGALLQNGFDPVLIYKLEIALFLIFAHICLFFFLRAFLKKNLCLFWKLIGLYIIYLTLVIYAAGGMFDSIPLICSLFAVTMFLSERYDRFFLFIGISVFLKYQAGIFLLPLIVVGLLKSIEKNKLGRLFRNKAVIAGAAFMLISAFTAYLSAQFLSQTRPELIMNGINAFASHTQIPWTLQFTYILLTLAVTLVYAFYMLNKNSLLSLSALFLLLPSFTLPYFQNWYIPYFFVYILIPQRKTELGVTMIWLIIMIALLAFSGMPLLPQQIVNNIQSLLKS
jgi:hypothetical protein